ncbi:MAG: MMPL family transporter [Chloroflexota bacterium]
MFAAWAHFVYRHRWLTLVGSLLLLVVSGVLLIQGGVLISAQPKGTQADQALTLLQNELPSTSGSSFTVVFGSSTLLATDPGFARAVQATLAGLHADPRVKAIQTPYDSTPPTAAWLSGDGHHALAVVSLKDNFDTARSYYEAIRARIHSDQLTVEATDSLAISADFDRYLATDLQRAERVSLPLALLLLLLVFGTVVAALLPLGVGLCAVLGGIAGIYLLTRVTDMTPYALNVVTIIGLGVAIDYSLFIVNRFREELQRGLSVPEALATSMATAGRAITFSGITVAIGLSGLLFYPNSYLSSMGLGGAAVVGFAVFYALTLLPALLALLGPRVNRWRLPLPQTSAHAGGGFWRRIATTVMRHPWWALLPTLLFILLAASPTLKIRLANGDVTSLPPDAESRLGYDLLTSQFPGRNQNQYSVLLYSPDGQPQTAARVGALYDLSRQIAALPHVLAVQGVVNLDPTLSRAQYQALYGGPRAALPAPMQEALRQTVGAHIAVLSVLSDSPTASDEARNLLRRIRTLAAPAGSEILVTGATAFDVDTIQFIVQHTPATIAFVIIVTYLLLFLLTGSVVLPLKAVVVNLLSISASFGAMVWIFQEGHLSAQLHFTPAPLDPTLPVLLFCIMFGLAMDYEVFLVTRIQEEYRRSGNNREAVAWGLERSGRLVTGAAAIMLAVFLAFALAQIVIIKAIGLGLAIAVLIDATLIRALVVPAMMRLLGNLNWWAPRPLARFQQALHLDEAGPPAETPIPAQS